MCAFSRLRVLAGRSPAQVQQWRAQQQRLQQEQRGAEERSRIELAARQAAEAAQRRAEAQAALEQRRADKVAELLPLQSSAPQHTAAVCCRHVQHSPPRRLVCC
jgi:hypothetical protein